MPDWNKVYVEKNVEEVTPASILMNNKHLLTGKGKALDYASGLGGNAVYLASQGYDVDAWDLSDIAVDSVNEFAKNNKLQLTASKFDLELSPPDISQVYDVIVVSFFLHRKTIRKLYEYLRKDGLLFYQTFSGEQINGVGPSRKEFRLNSSELLTIFQDMQLLYYREDPFSEGVENEAGQVQFVAKK